RKHRNQTVAGHELFHDRQLCEGGAVARRSGQSKNSGRRTLLFLRAFAVEEWPDRSWKSRNRADGGDWRKQSAVAHPAESGELRTRRDGEGAGRTAYRTFTRQQYSSRAFLFGFDLPERRQDGRGRARVPE